MPNQTARILPNQNPIYGGPYMDYHAAAPLIRNSTPSAYNIFTGSMVPSANDVDGSATGAPHIAAVWAKNNNPSHLNQGTQV